MMLPINVVKVWCLFMLKRVKTNLFHDGRRELSGRKEVATSREFSLKDIKAVTKARGTTINNLLTACLATSVK